MKYICVAVLILVALPAVWCWGVEGHSIIARIANLQLNSTAKAILQTYLGDKTLEQISPWADTYGRTSQGSWSKSCHYVNLPRTATEYSDNFCGACCAVEAVRNYTERVSMESGPCDFSQGSEPCALEFLVHFVGDLHQPLHVSYADDRGGNSVKVSFLGKSSNLHSAWDSLMIQHWDSSIPDVASILENEFLANPELAQKYLSNMDPASWADESFSLVKSDVYDFGNKRDEIVLTEAYYEKNLEVIKDRLLAAGIRLGAILNENLQ